MVAQGMKRYWPGKAPDVEDSADSASDEEYMSGEGESAGNETSNARRLSPPRRRRPTARVVEAPVVLEDGVAQGEDEEEAEGRRARIRARKRAAAEEEEELLAVEGEEEEEDSEKGERGDDSSKSSSSEYETASDESEEENDLAPQMLRPVFVRKEERTTLAERDRVEAEEAEKNERLVERKRERAEEAREIISRTVKAEIDAEGIEDDLEKGLVLPDDSDHEADAEAEHATWKVRELKRIQREQAAADLAKAEADEAEAFRKLPESEKKEILRKRMQEDEKSRQPKSSMAFMQKYYHKGAFFMERDEKGKFKEDVYNRDFNEAVEEDAMDKTMLPKPMQVRRGQLHMSGRSKHTHLKDEDTTFGMTYGNKAQVLGSGDVLPGHLVRKRQKRAVDDILERPRGYKRTKERSGE